MKIDGMVMQKGYNQMATIITAGLLSDIFQGNALNMLYGVALLIGVLYAAFLLFFHGIGDLFGDFAIDVHTDHDLGDMQLVDSHGVREATGVSTLAIASFVTAFGGGGLLARLAVDASGALSILIALGSGLLLGIAAQMFFVYILSPTISSEVHQTKLIGVVAEIVTPIPANGVGQIAFVAQGSRVTYSARATDQSQAMQRGTPVRIERIVGGMAYVSPVD
jgi:hypothetical protein